MDSASAGDIIYLHPSPIDYGSATMDKKLTIIGVGYDIPANADSTEIQTYTASSKVDDLILNAGADSSVIIGVDGHSGGGAFVFLGVSNILFQRNKIYRYLYITNSTNIIVNGNYFYSTAEGSYTDDKLSIQGTSSNILVNNNIFDVNDLTSGDRNVVVGSSALANFENNIFLDECITSNSSIKNNIFLNNYVPNLGTNVVEHNVFTNSSASIPPSNVIGANQDSIFVGIPTQGFYSLDGKYHLKTNSPAIGAGIGGVDAGIFDGNSPYKLSGIPFTPLIYEINAPTSGTSGSGLPVTIKVRANN